MHDFYGFLGNRLMHWTGFNLPSEQSGFREFGAFKSRRPKNMGKRRRF